MHYTISLLFPWPPSGDARVNEQPALTLIHTVFMRYHNVLAKQLKRASARGDGEEREWWRRRGFDMDEVIFQRTRAIVGAVMQNIMYSEWLPIVLGPSLRAKYRLDLSSDDRTRYNPRQDPRVFNAFSTAVFRYVKRTRCLTSTETVRLIRDGEKGGRG